MDAYQLKSKITVVKKSISKKSSSGLVNFIFLMALILILALTIDYLPEMFKDFYFPLILLLFFWVVKSNLFLQIFSPKIYKCIKLLDKAFKEADNSPEKALYFLIDAYNVYKSQELYNLISEIAENFGLEEYREIYETNKRLQDEKDKRIIEILNELKKILQYALEQKKIMHDLEAKIEKVKQDIKSAPEEMKHKFENLKDEYEKLLSLTGKKLQFYFTTKNELKQLLKEYDFYKKYTQEQQHLRQLQDKIYEGTIKEGYQARDFEEFIIEKQEFLKAVEEYAEKVNLTTEEEIFNELLRDFEKNKSK